MFYAKEEKANFKLENQSHPNVRHFLTDYKVTNRKPTYVVNTVLFTSSGLLISICKIIIENEEYCSKIQLSQWTHLHGQNHVYMYMYVYMYLYKVYIKGGSICLHSLFHCHFLVDTLGSSDSTS